MIPLIDMPDFYLFPLIFCPQIPTAHFTPPCIICEKEPSFRFHLLELIFVDTAPKRKLHPRYVAGTIGSLAFLRAIFYYLYAHSRY